MMQPNVFAKHQIDVIMNHGWNFFWKAQDLHQNIRTGEKRGP